MANTEHIEAKLCAYVDGELDAQGRAEIEQHLANNPQHRQLIEDLALQRDALKLLPRERAPDDLYENFSSQLERSVLLDSEPEADGAVAGRINPWPQVYAAAAVVLLVVGLAAVIYFVLPKAPAHKVSDFAIAPTTTGPVSMSINQPDATDLHRTDVARAVMPRNTNLVAARGPDFAGETLPLKNEVFGQLSGGELRGFAGNSSRFEYLDRLGDQSGLFESNLNRHVQQVTNGAVSNPMVVVLNTADPTAAEHQVTRFLGDNGITWQQLNEPAPDPLQLDPGQNVLMTRAQNIQMHLKTVATSSPAQSGHVPLAGGAMPTTRPALADSQQIVSKGGSPEAEAIQQQQSPALLKQLILARNLTARQIQGLNACVAPLQPVLLNSQSDGVVLSPSASGQLNGARAAATRAWAMNKTSNAGSSPSRARRFGLPAQTAATQPSTAPAALHPGDLVGLSTGTSTEIVIQTIDDKGQINVPNVGPVKVEGSTPEQGIDAILRACREKGLAPGNVSLLPIRSPASTQPAYTFKPGDSISVEYDYANPDLHRTPEVTVADDGTVKLPLLGEFQAWGQTAGQLARSIADAATRFDAGPAMFTVKSKDSANHPIVASAATTRPAKDAESAALPATGVRTSGASATQPAVNASSSIAQAPAATPASQPVAATSQPALSLAASAPTPPGLEAMVDVVIVVQPDPQTAAPTTSPAARAAPATQGFDLSLTPATAPTTAPTP